MEDRLMVSVSGVRGTIGATLTPRIACDFGCAFGTMLNGCHASAAVCGSMSVPTRATGGADVPSAAKKTVVIGRDTRPSGAMIQSAVTAGLLACGLDVVDLGVVTTPGVGLMAIKTQAAGAVMVTASHNPSQYNGIKFLQPNGCCLPAAAADRAQGNLAKRRFRAQASDGGRRRQSQRQNARPARGRGSAPFATRH